MIWIVFKTKAHAQCAPGLTSWPHFCSPLPVCRLLLLPLQRSYSKGAEKKDNATRGLCNKKDSATLSRSLCNLALLGCKYFTCRFTATWPALPSEAPGLSWEAPLPLLPSASPSSWLSTLAGTLHGLHWRAPKTLVAEREACHKKKQVAPSHSSLCLATQARLWCNRDWPTVGSGPPAKFDGAFPDHSQPHAS